MEPAQSTQRTASFDLSNNNHSNRADHSPSKIAKVERADKSNILLSTKKISGIPDVNAKLREVMEKAQSCAAQLQSSPLTQSQQAELVINLDRLTGTLDWIISDSSAKTLQLDTNNNNNNAAKRTHEVAQSSEEDEDNEGVHLLKKAQEYADNDEFEDAEKIFKDLHEKFPNELTILEGYANVLVNLDKDDAAIPLYQTLFEKQPREQQKADTWRSYGESLLFLYNSQAERLLRSQQAFLEAIKISSVASDYIGLAKIFTFQNNYTMAEQAIDNALQLEPNHFDALEFKAVIKYNQGDYFIAQNLIDTLLERNPNNINCKNKKGAILRKLGKIKEAEDLFIAILKAFPDHTMTLINFGKFLYEQNKWEEAKKQFLKVLEQDRYQPEAQQAVDAIDKILKQGNT